MDGTVMVQASDEGGSVVDPLRRLSELPSIMWSWLGFSLYSCVSIDLEYFQRILGSEECWSSQPESGSNNYITTR
jgi:hypothetical protein